MNILKHSSHWKLPLPIILVYQLVINGTSYKGISLLGKFPLGVGGEA